MSKTKSQKIIDPVIEYSLKDILIKKFTLFELDDSEIEEDELKIGINLSGKINEDTNVVVVSVNISISKKIDSDMANIGELKVEYLFQLSGISNLKEDGKTLLPRYLINTFNAISISTSRGILFAKFQGTKIQKLILPLIDLKKLEEESIQS